MNIRKLNVSDLPGYFELRLKGLKNSPRSFGMSYAEELKRGKDFFKPILEGTKPDFILGAFKADKLVGILGVNFLVAEKRSHKAFIWGVFVDESARKLGIGGKLLDEAILEIRKNPSIKAVDLTVENGDLGPNSLYQSRGFKTWGSEPLAMFVDGKYQIEDHMMLLL